MTTQPLVSARFSLQATSDLDIDVCELVFDNTNWNQPKMVKLNPLYDVAPYNRSTSYTIQYTADAPGEVFNGCGGVVAGRRTRIPDFTYLMGQCHITGDPHVGIISENGWNPLTAAQRNSSMGMNVPIHALGAFWAVKSNRDLSIQVKYEKCFRQTNESFQPSCLTGVYVQFQNEFVRVNLKGTGLSDLTVVSNSTTMNGMRYTRNSLTKHTIETNDAPHAAFFNFGNRRSRIEIVSSSRSVEFKSQSGLITKTNSTYFSLIINLSPIHYQQTEGHCNVFDFTSSVRSSTEHLLFNRDTITRAPFLDNTQTGQLIYDWAKSFEVLSEQNGFDTNTAIAFSKPSTCATDALKKLTTQKTSSEFKTSDTLSNQNLVRTNSSISSVEIAKQRCRACFALNSTVLEDLAHDDLISCIDDVILSGNDMFCQQHSLIASRKLLALVNSPNASASDLGLAHANDRFRFLATDVVSGLNLFRTSLSASTCNGRGSKGTDGLCYCNSGFSGYDCSASVSTFVSFSEGNPVPA